MWPALIITPFAIALVALLLANRSDRRQPVTAPDAEPVTTVIAHVVHARMTEPFAYDNGLAADGPDEEDQ